MARGTKNYFRHSINARKDQKIMTLMDRSKESYFHYFAILELCASQAENVFPEDSTFRFHPRTLAQELMVNRSRLLQELLKMQSCLLLEVVSKENLIELCVPKLRNYMGKYESKCTLNVPNKRKENKRKEKSICTEKEHTQNNEVLHDIIPELSKIDDSCLHVVKRMTESEQKKLSTQFQVSDVLEIIEEITSWKDYKTVKDVYLTARKWLRRKGINPISKEAIDAINAPWEDEK